jgi:hypothetical protein
MLADQRSCRAVAAILCSAAEYILWPEVDNWSPSDSAGHRLECRVGDGAATYYRSHGHYRHRLTFGWKMVASKHDPAMASQWLTGREMLQRGYFADQFNLPALLAHTCCHEFAHLVQGLNGWMARGSIHNSHFYRVLDSLYSAGAAHRVLAFIEQQAQARQLSLCFSKGHAESLPDARLFQMGELVSFEYRGTAVLGEVIRINRKTVNVKPIAPLLAAEYFRISPHYLKPYGEPT